MANFRPIALTSHIVKCFERVVPCHLRRQVAVFQDPLRFAYRKSVSVNDAFLYMLHSIYHHLEKKLAALAKLCFVISPVPLIQFSHIF